MQMENGVSRKYQRKPLTSVEEAAIARLRRLIEDSGLTYQEIANRAGYSNKSWLSHVMTGRIRLKTGVVSDLARALAVHPDKIWPGKVNPVIVEADRILDPKIISIALQLEDMPASQLRELEAILEFVYSKKAQAQHPLGQYVKEFRI